MLESKMAYAVADRLEALKRERDEARAALQGFVDIDNAANGRELVSNQGQAMDGYTKLACYEAQCRKARAFFVSLAPGRSMMTAEEAKIARLEEALLALIRDLSALLGDDLGGISDMALRMRVNKMIARALDIAI